MKLKRRRASEVPPKIRAFINNVIAAPLESIELPLKNFVWDFDKGDFHHWVELFIHFDSYFEKYIKPRKDLQLTDGFLNSDPPFPREAVLHILHVIRTILDNCTNKHFYSSYEQHLSSLLAYTDADIVEASLQTLVSFLKKTIGKHSIRDVSLNSKLFAFAQGWGGKEEGLGVTACALESGCDSIAYQLGCTLHFEFYALDDINCKSESSPGLQIIHLPDVSSCTETNLELLNKLVEMHKVPANLRFQLLTRLRFARAFSSVNSRQQYLHIRVYAFLVLVQASSGTNDLASFLNSEPEFINELVSLLSFEDAIPEKLRILSLLSLVALSQDRSQYPTVLAAVTSGGHRGILSSLMQKAIDSVLGESSKWSVAFAEALLSLVTVLVSSSSGCSAMREAGFIPTLLPLLKDANPQHLHLVSTAVHVLEAFMDYSNPAAALFRDLGGLNDTIFRLKEEVSIVENGSMPPCEDSDSGRTDVVGGTSSVLDDEEPLYSDAMVTYHRRLLLKALLRAISLGTYAPGSTSDIYSSEESLLPQCLCVIFRRAKDFGGGVFSLAATVMSDLIHKDPTSFSSLDAAGLPSAFMDAIVDGVLCSAEAITCIPQCLDALCLSNNGIQVVKDHNALSCFVKIFTSRTYLRALAGETASSLSSGLDELMRHASALRGPGVDMLIEILSNIVKIGSNLESASAAPDLLSSSAPVPMETDAKEASLAGDGGSIKTESNDPSDASSDASSASDESSLPDFVINASRLLETVLQNSDTCRIFFEKKGIDVVLQIFTLPHLPLSFSVGQSISGAFKNFSTHQSASLARAVCSFLKEHLHRTNELLDSVGGAPFMELDPAKQAKVLRSFWSLEAILSLSNSLLKGSATVISELGAGDADVLKDIGRTYREVLWQISLSCDSKVDEGKNVDIEPENTDVASSSGVGRESDDDLIPMPRYMNSVRTSSQSLWSGDRDFLSVIRSGEGLSRRARHALTRIRGRRVGHLDAMGIDSEISANLQESSSSKDARKKSPDVLRSEILMKLASTMRCFHTALVKGFTSPNRRRTDSTSVHSAAKNIGAALAKVFLDALSFSGHSTSSGVDTSLSVKCRYLGKVVDDIAAVTFDGRRRICYTAIVNNLYVSGAFKELLTTFEATSQLLWTLPFPVPSSDAEPEKSGEGKLPHSSWLSETLQSYCKVLEFFVNSSFLLSPTSTSQPQLLVQPAAVGLSIGLFPVPRDPEVFVRMLQSQVLDVILPVWNHPMFPACNPTFITSVLSIVTCIYSGVGDVKRNRSGVGGSINQRVVPPPDEGTIATIVEMGFSRARAEEALRRIGTNSVELAMEWLCNHVEEPVQEDDELARALALSLGSSAETSKADSSDKSLDVLDEEGTKRTLPVDDLLAASMKLFQSSDSIAFSLTDLLVTLCSRNKGEDRPKVASYLVQQLKLSPFDFGKDTNATATISHILALLLSEDSSTREVAVQNGIVSIAIDILRSFNLKTESASEVTPTRCISAVLLILDSLLQSRSKISLDRKEMAVAGSIPDSSVNQSLSVTEPASEREVSLDEYEKEYGFQFSKVLGKTTGFLSLEESQTVLSFVCDLLRLHVPAVVMQAVLQLCARLTKSHTLSLQFLESGSMTALFDLPRTSFFSGHDSLASAIVRHLLEDPQTLQTAMELEIRQVLSGSRHGGRIPVRTFLTSVAPVISRDPIIFMKAASSVCHLESSGGRTVVVLSKEKDKEKDRAKTSTSETGFSSGESLRISETRVSEGPGKGPKSHKKIPQNFSQVLDQLLEIVMQFPSANGEGDLNSCVMPMDVDEPATKVKGKSKVDEVRKNEADSAPERSGALAKGTFVLKLLCDILLMYVHAVGVILKRDSELCQMRGCSQLDQSHGGIVHHVIHSVLPLSVDKSAGPNDIREKLSEKASWFLVVLCGRSAEGRKRVVNELVKALSSYSNVHRNSTRSRVLPDRKVLAFADLVYSILSKNSSSSSLPISGYSPDVAKCMIDGGVVPCLTNMLQTLDLDHPDAPKVSNLILKSLELLTRAANASEQASKIDALNKKKSDGSQGISDDQANAPAAGAAEEHNQGTGSDQEVAGEGNDPNPLEVARSTEVNHEVNQGRAVEQDMGAEEGATGTIPPGEISSEFIREGNDHEGVIRSVDEIHVNFHVNNQREDDMGDEDDDMGDEGDEEDDDDEGEEEDEDIAEDGAALMSLADTDVEDHEDEGLGNEYNDEIVDEDDDYHGNRVIEVRWREGLDGFNHLQVLGQTGSGFIDVAREAFEGVNVDDLFGLRRPERRRQTNRSSFDRTNTGVLQHPLLSRPLITGDMGSLWSSSANMSRDSGLTGEQLDAAQFYMFDAPVLPFDHPPASLYGDRLSGFAPPPLTDYSIGVDLLQLNGRRVPGDGRWADDGQPQAGGQASVIAQAVEDLFTSLLQNNSPARIPGTTQVENTGQQDTRSDAVENIQNPEQEANNSGAQRPELDVENVDQGANDQFNLHHADASVEANVNSEECSIDEADGHLWQNGISSGNLDVSNNGLDVNDNMDIGDACFNLEEQTGTLHHVSSSVNPPNTSQNERASEIINDSQDVPMEGSGFGVDVVNDGENVQLIQPEHLLPSLEPGTNMSEEEPLVMEDPNSLNHTSTEAPVPNGIDPTFLEALPEDLRAEVLASQQSQSAAPPAYAPPPVEDIDPEFLAALPPDIQAEVLAQQRAQRVAQQSEGQPVDMDNASIIATLPADLREEVLLTSSEAVLSALPSPLLAEAQLLRDRAMSHYQARSIFGGSHRLTSRRNSLGFGQQSAMDRGVGVTIGRRLAPSISGDSLKVKEIEGEPLFDTDALKALIRLLRLAQPLSKGLLQRLLLNLCAHSVTRATLVRLLLNMIKPECNGIVGSLAMVNSQRLYGCPLNVVYGRSQSIDGLPPLVLRRVLEALTYLATNHSAVATILFYSNPSPLYEISTEKHLQIRSTKGKEKVEEAGPISDPQEDIPFVLFLKLLNRPLFLRSSVHLEQVMGLLQVVICTAASRLEIEPIQEHTLLDNSQEVSINRTSDHTHSDVPLEELASNSKKPEAESKNNTEANHESTPCSQRRSGHNVKDIFLQLPQTDLCNLCHLLGREGLSDKVYTHAGEVLKKLASVAPAHRKFFTLELSELAQTLCQTSVSELMTLKNTHMTGLSASSMAGAAMLRVLQVLSSLTSVVDDSTSPESTLEETDHAILQKLNDGLDPLWEGLSDCINTAEAHLGQSTESPITATLSVWDNHTVPLSSPPLPPGTQRLLPFIEAFFVLCEKIQSNNITVQPDHANVTAREVKESISTSASASMKCSGDSQRRYDGVITFSRFAEKHRRLLNAFVRQNPGLLEKSLSMMLKVPRLIDFDNKRAYFRSRIRQQHEQHLTGPLRISIRRAYVLEDSYNQLRMKPTQDLKGRLNVHFQGEEGIDAGGLTREWYQLLSRVLFDKGALLFTTVGNNATFQPNPNSVYQTEHLSYFKFVGRVVAKALFDGQLLDVYFTRSFYKHILGVKVTYHDIEAVDPDYYKNLKWVLENDISDIPDLTFSMDADEEKLILYEKTEVTDHELKPGGRNIRVTEETKHEYVDLVADHILTNAIRPQITSFLQGFNELVPRELISIFNDKELELLISGLPEIDLDDLKANTEYTGYSSASHAVQWFWEVVGSFNKEDMARLLQFVTGTSKIPLEGFRALQGISGPQKFQIHKAYGAPERLPSAHTCFNQLDLPEYSSKEQLKDRLLLAIHEASEGFGFG
ncbi:hypothetical protein V2J09_015195 [Rumex salicifolius]